MPALKVRSEWETWAIKISGSVFFVSFMLFYFSPFIIIILQWRPQTVPTMTVCKSLRPSFVLISCRKYWSCEKDASWIQHCLWPPPHVIVRHIKAFSEDWPRVITDFFKDFRVCSYIASSVLNTFFSFGSKGLAFKMQFKNTIN